MSFILQFAAADSRFIEFNNYSQHSSPTTKEKKGRGWTWNGPVVILTCMAVREHVLIFWLQLKQVSVTAHPEISQTCLRKADDERTWLRITPFLSGDCQ